MKNEQGSLKKKSRPQSHLTHRRDQQRIHFETKKTSVKKGEPGLHKFWGQTKHSRF